MPNVSDDQDELIAAVDSRSDLWGDAHVDFDGKLTYIA